MRLQLMLPTLAFLAIGATANTEKLILRIPDAHDLAKQAVPFDMAECRACVTMEEDEVTRLTVPRTFAYARGEERGAEDAPVCLCVRVRPHVRYELVTSSSASDATDIRMQLEHFLVTQYGQTYARFTLKGRSSAWPTANAPLRAPNVHINIVLTSLVAGVVPTSIIPLIIYLGVLGSVGAAFVHAAIRHFDITPEQVNGYQSSGQERNARMPVPAAGEYTN